MFLNFLAIHLFTLSPGVGLFWSPVPLLVPALAPALVPGTGSLFPGLVGRFGSSSSVDEEAGTVFWPLKILPGLASDWLFGV